MSLNNPTYTELYIYQGTDFSHSFHLRDELTNSNVNTAGYIITSQLRRSYYSANSSANLTCTLPDNANGRINIALAAANTSNLKIGRYLFDVKAKNTSNVTYRILEGIITVSPAVTK